MDLRTIVPYTTRPIRAGEENGVEYFFAQMRPVFRPEGTGEGHRGQSL